MLLTHKNLEDLTWHRIILGHLDKLETGYYGLKRGRARLRPVFMTTPHAMPIPDPRPSASWGQVLPMREAEMLEANGLQRDCRTSHSHQAPLMCKVLLAKPMVTHKP